jgi:hypothetical protein
MVESVIKDAAFQVKALLYCPLAALTFCKPVKCKQAPYCPSRDGGLSSISALHRQAWQPCVLRSSAHPFLISGTLLGVLPYHLTCKASLDNTLQHEMEARYMRVIAFMLQTSTRQDPNVLLQVCFACAECLARETPQPRPSCQPAGGLQVLPPQWRPH